MISSDALLAKSFRAEQHVGVVQHEADEARWRARTRWKVAVAFPDPFSTPKEFVMNEFGL